MSLLHKVFLTVVLPFTLLSGFVFYLNISYADKGLLKILEKEYSDKIIIIQNELQNKIDDIVNKIVKIVKKQTLNKEIAFALKFHEPMLENIDLVYIKNKRKVHLFGKKIKFNPFNSKKFNFFLKNQKQTIEYYRIKKNNYLMNIFVPLKINKSKIAKALIISLDYKFVYRVLSSLPNNNSIALISLEGKKPFIIFKKSDIPLNLKEVLKNANHIRYANKNNTTNLIVQKKFIINNHPYFIIYSQNNNQLTKIKKELLRKNLILFGAGIVFCIFYILLQLKIIFSPIRKLINDVNVFAGKFSNKQSEKNKFKIKDEILSLNKSFLTLKKQIGSYSKEIKEINDTLDSYLKETKGKNIHLEKEVNSKVKEIQFHVYHDSLTGLPNRRLFNDRLEMAIAYVQRNSMRLAVLFLDLDDFKNINDTVGHHLGDLFLKKISDVLKLHLREQDTVSRFGGDEFVLIIPNIESIQGVKEIATRILKAISRPFLIEGYELKSSGSMGITIYPRDGKDVNSLLKNADMAMYHAKKSGKNKFSIFSKEMNDTIVKKIALESKLRKAVNNKEFKLFYQPKVDLNTGFTTGMEALVRWQKDEDTLVSPDEFIFIAEESDIICHIGEWVLEKACLDTVKIHKYGYKVSVAVNISARQFQSDDFLDLTEKILKKTGLPPEYLNIEITENIVMSDIYKAIEIMKKLNALNVKISIDDFGTGYSSLNYLKQFPVHYLKIDRSFIKDIPDNMEDVAISKSIILLAHSLYLKVVAEGVENWSHLKFLKENECDEIQGYFCSMPVTAPELLQMLRKGPLLV